MDFKKTTKMELDEKYAQMLDSSASMPYDKMPKLQSEQPYENKRNAYYDRLEAEKSEFNDARETVRDRRNRRIERENEEANQKGHRKFKNKQKLKIIAFFLPVVVALIAGMDIFDKSRGHLAPIAEAAKLPTGGVIALYAIYCVTAMIFAISLTIKMLSKEKYINRHVIHHQKAYNAWGIFILLVGIAAASLNLVGIEYIDRISTEQYYAQFSFSELENGTYSVQRAEGVILSEKLEIPSEYNEKAVTVVCEAGFKDCNDILELTIPNSIVTVGSGAFENCVKLSKVIIGDGVETLSANTFANCNNLISLTLGKSVATIDETAFSGCYRLVEVYNLSKLQISTEDHAGIGAYALDVYTSTDVESKISKKDDFLLYNTDGETLLVAYSGTSGEVVIPEGVTHIRYNTFYNNTSIYNITIPESVVNIGTGAFSQCTGLTVIKYNAIECQPVPKDANVFYKAGRERSGIRLIIGKNVKSIPDNLFGASEFGPILTFPNIEYIVFEENSSCERIGDYAFYFGFELESVELPDTIKYVGDYAFYQCARLDEITIPKSVTYLGEECFAACMSLRNIYFNAENCDDLTYSSRAFCFAGESAQGCEVTVGANVKRIPAYLFYMMGAGYDNINRVTFEEGSQCKSIGENAFTGCLKLKSVNIPQSVTLIEKKAFCDCIALTSVTFENKNSWYVTGDIASTMGLNITIESASDAATKLVNNYDSSYWKRAE